MTMPLTHPRYAITTLTLTGLLFSLPVNAGGLWAQDFGDPSMGRAGAGAASGVDDASTVFHNTAYMTELTQEQVMLSGGLIYTDLEFDLKSVDESSRRGQQAGNDEGGNPGGLLGGASLFYTAPINENWAWGTSFTAASGGLSDYDNDWVGRFDTLELTLAIAALAPAIAYKINDDLSIGASAEFLYAFVELALALPSIEGLFNEEQRLELEGDDFIVSYSLSAAYTLSDSTRIGIKYQPEFTVKLDDLDLEEPSSIDPKDAIKADITYGQYIRLGITHEIDNKLSIYGTLGWDDWSALDKVPLTLRGNEINVDESWKDTYHTSIGVSYLYSPQWLFSAGITHDTSPVDNDKRYAQLAVDKQTRIGFGVQHNYGEDFTIGGQFLILDAGENEIERTNWYYTGEFDRNRAYQLMMNANWKF